MEFQNQLRPKQIEEMNKQDCNSGINIKQWQQIQKQCYTPPSVLDRLRKIYIKANHENSHINQVPPNLHHAPIRILDIIQNQAILLNTQNKVVRIPQGAIPKQLREEAQPYIKAMKGANWPTGHILNWTDAFIQKRATMKHKMEQRIKMNRISLQCVPSYVYLGTICNQMNPDNLVSGRQTMRRFKSKMISKQQYAVHDMGVDYWNLPTMIRLKFISTFYTAYTHTYAQILPPEMIPEMDDAQLISTMHMLKIKTHRVDKPAFQVWTGISSTRDKYNAAKVGFLHKIHHHHGEFEHYLHKGFKNKTITNYRPYEELTEALDMVLPAITIEDLTKKKTADLKAELNYAQIQQKMNQLSQYNPMKITNWKPKKFTPYKILDFKTCSKELSPCFQLNDKDMDTFNELFYRFSIWDQDPTLDTNDYGDKFCKICGKSTKLPMKVHTAICCPRLKTHRRAFCQYMHTKLGKIYKRGHWVHQQRYAQQVLNTLHNIATNQRPSPTDNRNFWKIICGADHTKTTHNKQTGIMRHELHYNGHTAKLKTQRLFWEATRALSGKYLYAIHRCWTAKDPRRNIKNKWKEWPFEHIKKGTNFNHRRLHWNCANAQELKTFLTKNNINEHNTIIISTDGSMKSIRNRKYAGFGIIIKFKGKTYRFAQGIGCQDILYAELRALVAGFKLAEWLKLPIASTPICILTDSRICFEYYFGEAAKKDAPFPSLTKQFHELTHKYNTCLIKIPSHENRFGRQSIELNDQADKLAEIGRNAAISTKQFHSPSSLLGPLTNHDSQSIISKKSDQHLRYDPVTFFWYHSQVVTLQGGGTTG